MNFTTNNEEQKYLFKIWQLNEEQINYNKELKKDNFKRESSSADGVERAWKLLLRKSWLNFLEEFLIKYTIKRK